MKKYMYKFGNIYTNEYFQFMNSQNKKKEKSGVRKNIQVSTAYEYRQIYKTNFGKKIKRSG